MSLFGSEGFIGQINNNLLGGPFQEPGRTRDVWSSILQNARGRWEGATTGEVSRLGQSQQQMMGGFSPYIEQFRGMAGQYGGAATAGLSGFQNLLSNPSQITADPLYKARLASGTSTIENSAAARGMQLSGANLLDLGNFGSELAANTLDQRLGQFGQLTSMGLGGLEQGFRGMGDISQMNMGYDAMLNRALYGGLEQQTDIMGAEAQANAAAELGYLNAQTENKSAHMGAIGSIMGGMMGGL